MPHLATLNNFQLSAESKNRLCKISTLAFVGVSTGYLFLSMLRDVLPSGTNAVLGALLIISSASILQNKRDYILLSILCVGELITLFYSSNISQNLDTFANALFATEVFLVIQNAYFRKQFNLLFKKNVALYWIILAGYPIFLAILLIIPECWNLKQAWDGTYFTAFTAEQAVAANSCAYISLALYLMSLRGKNVVGVLGILLNCYVIVVTGARVFIICVVVLLFFGVRLFTKSVRATHWTGVAMMAIASAVVACSSTFRTKMANAMKMQGVAGFTFIDALTNSRTIFWANDVTIFFNSNGIIQWLFGCGHDYVYNVNLVHSGYQFWAHNDFIQMLVGQGFLGLSVYVFCMIGCIAVFNKYTFGKAEFVLVLIYIVGTAFLNGILVYPNYSLSLVFLVMFLKQTKRIMQEKAQ